METLKYELGKIGVQDTKELANLIDEQSYN